jgi:hypothetical protein
MSDLPESESRPDGRTWKEVLVADRWRLLGVLLLAGAALVFLGYEVEIPRWARLFLIAASVTAALGYPAAARLVAWLYRPNYTFLVDLDARRDDLAVWRLPPKTWRDLEVQDGELYQIKSLYPAWECKDYDPEENTANGTWRGSASDLELIEDRDRIDEIRTILEDLAQEGLSIRIKQSGIIRSSIRGIVMSFVEGFEKETLYDGDQIKKSVEKALDRWDLKDEKELPGDPDGPGSDGSLTEENIGRPRPSENGEVSSDD